MSKQSMSDMVNGIGLFIKKRGPEILTGIGIAGMVTTTVLAVKATPKAMQLVKEKEDYYEIKLTKKEIIATCWKCYIPAAVTCALSMSCLIGASSVNLKRNAALATAYKLSETALTEYQEKVVETIGEKKERAVRDKIAEDKVKKDPVGSHEVIVTKSGTTLCYDGVFGRYFNSDIDTIKRAATKINRQIICDMYASLNDFYDEIGLSHINIGDDLGWNIDDGNIDIDFSSQLAENGTPCLVISYNVAPKYEFSSLV